MTEAAFRNVLAQILLNICEQLADVEHMHVPQSKQESSSLKKFAQASLENPGMYLIALRSHIGRGKSMIGQVLNSVADTLPANVDAPAPDVRIITR